MRRRTAIGWRRWALGVCAGTMLCAVTGLGAASVAHALTLPSLPPVPLLSTPAAQPPVPPLPLPSLPFLSPTPCATCPVLGGGSTPTPNPNPNPPGTTTVVSAPAPTPASSSAAAASSAPGVATAPRQRGGYSPAGGLNMGPPPSVLAIGPGTAISFGKAPFLWPLFAALDVFGLVVVVTVVRKTWSRSASD